MTDTDDRTPFQVDRDRAERTGTLPEGWGHFHHRHFASDAIHRDGGPECDQPGTPRRVYVFDPDTLDAHEAIVARWAAGQALLAAADLLATADPPVPEAVRGRLADLLARYDVRLERIMDAVDAVRVQRGERTYISFGDQP